MNPKIVQNYFENKPKLKKISLWIVRNLEIFNLQSKLLAKILITSIWRK